MLGVARNVVVHFRDVNILLGGDRPTKIETSIVEAVACVVAIGFRPSVEILEHRLARSNVERVHIGDLCRRERIVSRCDHKRVCLGWGDEIGHADGPARAQRRIEACVFDDAILHSSRRNCICHASGLGTTRGFEVHEKI